MKNSKLLIGLITGTAIGAALGILFAQKEGKKTRKHIAKSIHELVDAVTKESSHIIADLKDKLAKIQQPV